MDNILIMEVPERKEEGAERLFKEKMAKSVQNWMKDINLQIQDM